MCFAAAKTARVALAPLHSRRVQVYAVRAMVTEAPVRGAFILFEGVDRSGKSTQVAKLVEKLKSTGVSGLGGHT